VSVAMVRPPYPPHDPRLIEACDRARGYLLERESPDGGFCFYRTADLEEPNLFDTWHAVAALALLGAVPAHRTRLIRFVAEQGVVGELYSLYYRARILHALGVADTERAAVRALVAERAPCLPEEADAAAFSSTLDRLRMTLWLKRHAGTPFPARRIADALRAVEHPKGGYGVPANLLDTRAALAILALCQQRVAHRTNEFVSRLAVPGLGFRLTDDSLTSNLETTCAGLACARRLWLTVPVEADAIGFILACQSVNGGFARAPGALPGIGLTHLALTALRPSIDALDQT